MSGKRVGIVSNAVMTCLTILVLNATVFVTMIPNAMVAYPTTTANVMVACVTTVLNAMVASLSTISNATEACLTTATNENFMYDKFQ